MRGRASWVSSNEGWFLRLLSWPLTPPQCATRSWCCTTPTTRTPGPFQVRAAPWVERPVTWMQRARCPFKLEDEGILLPPLYLKPFHLSHIRLILHYLDNKYKLHQNNNRLKIIFYKLNIYIFAVAKCVSMHIVIFTWSVSHAQLFSPDLCFMHIVIFTWSVSHLRSYFHLVCVSCT